jgi:hypothetical protein
MIMNMIFIIYTERALQRKHFACTPENPDKYARGNASENDNRIHYHCGPASGHGELDGTKRGLSDLARPRRYVTFSVNVTAELTVGPTPWRLTLSPSPGRRLRNTAADRIVNPPRARNAR